MWTLNLRGSQDPLQLGACPSSLGSASEVRQGVEFYYSSRMVVGYLGTQACKPRCWRMLAALVHGWYSGLRDYRGASLLPGPFANLELPVHLRILSWRTSASVACCLMLRCWLDGYLMPQVYGVGCQPSISLSMRCN